MTAGLLERPTIETQIQDCCEIECISECEITKEELCKKLCMNILEGLLEGYESLKQKSPNEAKSFEPKIFELKCEIDRQKVLA